MTIYQPRMAIYQLHLLDEVEPSQTSQTDSDQTSQTGQPEPTQTGQDQTEEETKKLKAQLEDYKKTLDDLKASLNMTEEQKKSFEQKTRELENSKLTTEQQYERQLQELQNKLDTTQSSLEEREKAWQKRFEDEKIRTEILSAATNKETEAYNPSQILSLLRPNTYVTEELDSDGNSTGNFKTLVNFSDEDKDGNPITLDLSPKEALKRMNDKPDQYGNLFKQNVTNGMSLNRNSPGSKDTGPPVGDPKAYREWREQNKDQVTR